MSRRSTKSKYQVVETMRAGLDFPDLTIRLSSGMTRALHVEAGQFIPVELLDDKDVALSEHSGCINRALKAGWIRDINAPVAPKKEETPVAEPSQPKHDYKLVETISPEEFAKMRDKTGVVSNMNVSGTRASVTVETMKFNGSMPVQDDSRAVGTTKEGTSTIMTPEVRQDSEDVLKSNIEKIQQAAGSGEVREYMDFGRLTHFAKLDFIKITTNTTLLKEIVEKSEVKQLVNNANGRLRELETTAK